MQKIDDVVMEQMEILAKLCFSPKEREEMKAGMEQMLAYVGKLEELDLEETKPDFHLLPPENVFRKDKALNPDRREEMLQNAPVKREGHYQVPKTV